MVSLRTPVVIIVTACVTYLLVMLQHNQSLVLVSSNPINGGKLLGSQHLLPGVSGPTVEGELSANVRLHHATTPAGESRATNKSGAQQGAKIRVGYMIISSKEHHHSRLPTLMSTWGKHANILFIASDATEPSNPLIMDLKEKGKASLGKKALKMMEMVCGASDAKSKLDYVVMVDDDTYMVTSNLEAFLSEVDVDAPGYYGYSLTHTKVPFIGGGGGIVFSRGTMAKFCDAARSASGPNRCQWASAANLPGDIAVFLCMQHLGIAATHVDGFHPFPVHQMVDQPKNWCTETWWVPKHLKCPPVARAISFHYLPLDRWREVYYWTYVYERHTGPAPTN